MDEEEFWGEYVIPMISKKDPSYNKQDYFRGRIWPPVNYLIFEALHACDQQNVASKLAKKGFNMFLKCWKEKGFVGENYNAITGETAEKSDTLWFSDKFYHWGALLVYMSLQTTLDFDVWKDQVLQYKRPDWLEPVYGMKVNNKTMNI